MAEYTYFCSPYIVAVIMIIVVYSVAVIMIISVLFRPEMCDTFSNLAFSNAGQEINITKKYEFDIQIIALLAMSMSNSRLKNPTLLIRFKRYMLLSLAVSLNVQHTSIHDLMSLL